MKSIKRSKIHEVIRHSEYCIQFHAPRIKKNMDRLELVQRRATKTMKDWKSYEEWLKDLGMFDLQKRSLRGDMIAIFKNTKV